MSYGPVVESMGWVGNTKRKFIELKERRKLRGKNNGVTKEEG